VAFGGEREPEIDAKFNRTIRSLRRYQPDQVPWVDNYLSARSPGHPNDL